MASRGAQPGNNNHVKGKMWEGALKRALNEKPEILPAIARKVVMAALQGEQWAIDHIANRLDGKPVQPVDGEFVGSLTVELVRLGDPSQAALPTPVPRDDG